MMQTIGIIGTRRRDSQEDFELTKKAFTEIYKPDDKICSGLCPKGGTEDTIKKFKKFHPDGKVVLVE